MCCLDAHIPVLQHTTPTRPVRHSITVADINKVRLLRRLSVFYELAACFEADAGTFIARCSSPAAPGTWGRLVEAEWLSQTGCLSAYNLTASQNGSNAAAGLFEDV